MTLQNSKRTLLIIDDDRNLCNSVSSFLSNPVTEVLVANTGAEGLNICSRRKVDVVFLDQRLPDTKGIDLCTSILASNDRPKIIFITAYPDIQYAVNAIKLGAHDYLSKPFEIEELKLALDQALRVLDLERVEQVQRYKYNIKNKETVLIGGNQGLREVQSLVDLAAVNDSSVLITGETGTGKSLVAKSIHYRGHVKNAAFISHNCAALPENLIEAELFGYEKGAFTGASADKKGIFEMAEGGTLFLDEIAELPSHLQSKLLGVLDDKKIKKLGGQSVKSVNARIIAATNSDIDKAIIKKRFREDLYYRLSVIRIHIPPLRERPEDIPELCRHFVRKFRPAHEIRLPNDEIARLAEYHWPGNVRELRNIIERAIILRKNFNIDPSRLLREPAVAATSYTPSSLDGERLVTLKELEKNYIKYALKKDSGNHTRMARDLGISRSTLIRKLKTYRLS